MGWFSEWLFGDNGREKKELKLDDRTLIIPSTKQVVEKKKDRRRVILLEYRCPKDPDRKISVRQSILNEEIDIITVVRSICPICGDGIDIPVDDLLVTEIAMWDASEMKEQPCIREHRFSIYYKATYIGAPATGTQLGTILS